MIKKCSICEKKKEIFCKNKCSTCYKRIWAEQKRRILGLWNKKNNEPMPFLYRERKRQWMLMYCKKGKNSPSWKNGKTKDVKGYMRIFVTNHPFSYKNHYIMEHRLIVEKSIGRYLNPQEVVHHINGIKDDNRIENLILFPNESEHRKYHNAKNIY